MTRLLANGQTWPLVTYQISGQDCNETLETLPNALYSLLTTDATATIAAPEITVRWWTISDVHQAV